MASLGPFWASQVAPDSAQEPPKCPQSRPERPKDPSAVGFWSIWGALWDTFGVICSPVACQPRSEIRRAAGMSYCPSKRKIQMCVGYWIPELFILVSTIITAQVYSHPAYYCYQKIIPTLGVTAIPKLHSTFPSLQEFQICFGNQSIFPRPSTFTGAIWK